jgi:hypothetical protein
VSTCIREQDVFIVVPKRVFAHVAWSEYLNSLHKRCRGVEVWNEARGLLEAAGVRCESFVTTHRGHAIQETAAIDLDAYACIVVVGGDGSVHEVVQVWCPSALDTDITHACCDRARQALSSAVGPRTFHVSKMLVQHTGQNCSLF